MRTLIIQSTAAILGLVALSLALVALVGASFGDWDLHEGLDPHQAPYRVRNALSASEPHFANVSCYTGIENDGATGRVDGVSAATWRYPIGTWLFIEGIGKRRVDTVPSQRFADRIDVWFGYDYAACIRFGVQTRHVRPL